MSKTDRLTHVEEIELIREYRNTGDKKVLDRIVLANTGLVHKLVNKFPLKNASVAYDDLFQEGIAGLIHGIRKFDTTKGYRLSTYCYNWIRAYIQRYYQNHCQAVRVPVHISDAAQTLRKQVELLTVELGRTPTMDEISAVNGDASKILDNVKNNVSLNTSVGENVELEELQGEDKTEEFEVKVDVDILLAKLQSMVSERDFVILQMRYGLNGYDEMTLDEVGKQFSITRARTHQIQSKMLKLARTLV